jgi:tetratricopeptide (TPR) repeat protein
MSKTFSADSAKVVASRAKARAELAREIARQSLQIRNVAQQAKVRAIKAANEALNKPVIPYNPLSDENYANHYNRDDFWWLSEWDHHLDVKREKFIMGKREYSRKQYMKCRHEEIYTIKEPKEDPFPSSTGQSTSGLRQSAEMRLSVAETAQDEAGLREALSDLMRFCSEDKDFASQIEYSKRFYKHAVKNYDLHDQSLGFESIGNAYYHMGNFQIALDMMRRGLELAQDAEHHGLITSEDKDADRAVIFNTQINLHCNIGSVFIRMGLVKEAQDAYGRAYNIADDAGDGEGMRLAERGLAKLHERAQMTDTMVNGTGQQQRALVNGDVPKQAERVGQRVHAEPWRKAPQGIHGASSVLRNSVFAKSIGKQSTLGSPYGASRSKRTPLGC